jgi:hypothetical protein
MFKKLVANLPFNPSLISQVTFYTERLQRERAIRSVGFMFIIMTMFVQMFAVVSPPAKSLESSSNHIINGVQTRDDILRAWDDPSTDVAKIYGLFGATRNDIQSLPVSPNTTLFSGDGNNYWTIGRNSLFAYENVEQQYKDSQITIQYEGDNTDTKSDDSYIYNRDLRAWDIINKSGNRYEAFQGKLASTGGTFWILVDCGNFTQIDPYVPPTPEPDPGLVIRKKIVGTPETLAPGDTYTYEIEYRNNKRDSTAQDVVIEDKLDLANFEVIKPTDLNINNNGLLRYRVGDLPFSDQFKSLKITVKLKNNIQSDRSVCNEASIRGSNADPGQSKKVCVDVVVPVPGLVIRKNIIDRPEKLAPGDEYTYAIEYRNNKKDSVAKDVVIEDQLDLANFVVTKPTDLNINNNGLLRHKVGNLPYSAEFSTLKITVKLKNTISSDTNVCNEASIRGSNADPGQSKKVCVDVVVPLKPAVKIIKTIVDRPTFVKPGDTFSYLIQYRNTVNASLAKDVVITDELDITKYEVIKIRPSTATVTNGFMEYKVGNLGFSNDYKSIRITVKVKDQIATDEQICNASRIDASNADYMDSQRVCIKVLNPCPYDSEVPTDNNPNCVPKVICDVVTSAINHTTRKVTLKTTASPSAPAMIKINAYRYDFGDGSPVLTQRSGAFTNEAEHTYAPGKFTAKVTVLFEAKGVSGERTSSECERPITLEEDKALALEKSVKNITKDKTGDAAVTTTLSANDVLEYTLTTTNPQTYPRVGVEVSDYIGDILDYAVLDEAFLKEKGGTYDPTTKKITWRDVGISASGEVLHAFRVKVKDPIPSTNQPSNMTTNFDCKISNEYGNTITINVDCPLVKGIETLPNTGPGSSLLMTVGITTIIGYFFARSRLFAREMALVKNDYVATGGM